MAGLHAHCADDWAYIFQQGGSYTLRALRCADTHLHFLLEYCNGGELYALLNSQPK